MPSTHQPNPPRMALARVGVVDRDVVSRAGAGGQRHGIECVVRTAHSGHRSNDVCSFLAALRPNAPSTKPGFERPVTAGDGVVSLAEIRGTVFYGKGVINGQPFRNRIREGLPTNQGQSALGLGTVGHVPTYLVIGLRSCRTRSSMASHAERTPFSFCDPAANFLRRSRIGRIR